MAAKIREYALFFAIGLGTSGLGTYYTTNYLSSPKEIIFFQKNDGNTVDLNRDSVPDLIIEQTSGHWIPMFGVKDNGEIRYISAREMENLNPSSIIDYGAIESNLNKR